MTHEEVQVAHVGLGAIGREVARLLVHRTGIRVVAVCDVSPDLVGTSLAAALDEDLHDDVTIVESLADASASWGGADLVVTHTTSSALARCLPELLAAIESGAHVVSSCEELSYPWFQAPDAAATLDRAARAAGVSVVGTGVNPGFAMDCLPVVLSGAARHVESVRVHRVQDAGLRRRPLQAKVGAGISPEEFRRRVAAGTIGHVGLTESAQAVAAALGWAPSADLVTQESIEPVLAESPVPSAFGTI
jgi:4-hydroxy-tetrahydrodipicolinate reductase